MPTSPLSVEVLDPSTGRTTRPADALNLPVQAFAEASLPTAVRFVPDRLARYEEDSPRNRPSSARASLSSSRLSLICAFRSVSAYTDASTQVIGVVQDAGISSPPASRRAGTRGSRPGVWSRPPRRRYRRPCPP